MSAHQKTDLAQEPFENLEEMLELAARLQRFTTPDDELTRVVSACLDDVAHENASRAEDAGASGAAGAGDGANTGTSSSAASPSATSRVSATGKPSAGTNRVRTQRLFPTRAPHQLPEGTLLDGRYLVEDVLGQGGFGITYRGRDTLLGSLVAIKEYYPHGYVHRDSAHGCAVGLVKEADREFVEKGRARFLEEAQALARFQDLPGVVDVHTYFEENQTAYIVMEHLQGTDLRTHLRSSLPFEADETFALFAPILDALERIHETGMLHRDISPDNVMLLDSGELKLMDFGAARQLDYDAPRTISLILKPGYAPQEQYLPKANMGPWTDIYALCATLYCCITGSTPPDVLKRLEGTRVEWPSELGFRISPQQENALRAGMALEPDERLRSIGQMRRVLNGEEELARTQPMPWIDLSAGASETSARTRAVKSGEEGSGEGAGKAERESNGWAPGKTVGKAFGQSGREASGKTAGGVSGTTSEAGFGRAANGSSGEASGAGSRDTSEEAFGDSSGNAHGVANNAETGEQATASGRGGSLRRRVLAGTLVAVALALLGVLLGVNLLAHPRLSEHDVALVVGAGQEVALEHADGAVEWRVDDKTVVELSADGPQVHLQAVGPGRTTVMAVHNGRLYELPIAVDAPKLSTRSLKMEVGASQVVELAGTELAPTWSSDKESVAEIALAANGKATITAKKAGTAKITATVCGVDYTCKVTVAKKKARSGSSAGATAGTGGTGGATSGSAGAGGSSGSGRSYAGNDGASGTDAAGDGNEPDTESGEDGTSGDDDPYGISDGTDFKDPAYEEESTPDIASGDGSTASPDSTSSGDSGYSGSEPSGTDSGTDTGGDDTDEES